MTDDRPSNERFLRVTNNETGAWYDYRLDLNTFHIYPISGRLQSEPTPAPSSNDVLTWARQCLSDPAAGVGDFEHALTAAVDEIERLQRERDERAEWATGWHRVVEAIAILLEVSPNGGADEMAGWIGAAIGRLRAAADEPSEDGPSPHAALQGATPQPGADDRVAFEAWAVTLIGSHVDSIHFQTRDRSTYSHPTTLVMWWAWEAACRAALPPDAMRWPTTQLRRITQEDWDHAVARIEELATALRATIPLIEQHTPRLSTAGTMVSLREQVLKALRLSPTKEPRHLSASEERSFTETLSRSPRRVGDEKSERPHRLDRFGDCVNPGCTYPSVSNFDKDNCTAAETDATLCSQCNQPAKVFGCGSAACPYGIR